MSGGARSAGTERPYDRVDAAAGEVLCARGERLNALYVIRAGEVELVGHERREVLGPGRIFGEFGVDCPTASSWTVRALSEASLLRIDGAGLQQRLADRRGGMPSALQGRTGWNDRLIVAR